MIVHKLNINTHCRSIYSRSTGLGPRYVKVGKTFCIKNDVQKVDLLGPSNGKQREDMMEIST